MQPMYLCRVQWLLCGVSASARQTHIYSVFLLIWRECCEENDLISHAWHSWKTASSSELLPEPLSYPQPPPSLTGGLLIKTLLSSHNMIHMSQQSAAAVCCFFLFILPSVAVLTLISSQEQLHYLHGGLSRTVYLIIRWRDSLEQLEKQVMCQIKNDEVGNHSNKLKSKPKVKPDSLLKSLPLFTRFHRVQKPTKCDRSNGSSQKKKNTIQIK